MVQRACTKCGRIGCKCSKKKPWANSTRRSRLPRDWQGRRQVVLRRDPTCQDGRVCQGLALSVQVDHIVNGDDHSYENLQGICVDCHKAKTSEEGRKARSQTVMPIPEPQGSGPPLVVALVGAPAVGKSTMAGKLVQLTNYAYRSIDDCGPRGSRVRRWTELCRWVDEQDGPCITESNVIPREFAVRLNRTNHLVVEVVADEALRRERLDTREGSWGTSTVDVGVEVDLQVTGVGGAHQIVRELGGTPNDL